MAWYKVAMAPRKHRPSSHVSVLPSRFIHQAYWMYGRHTVLAALRNPRRHLDRLLATRETVSEAERTTASAPIPRPRPEIVDRRVISALVAPDAVHQGLATLARPLSPTPLEEALASERESRDALLVVLDQVTDPRNVGAVLRSADAFAAAAVVVQDRHAPEEAGALAKAASGALETVPLIRVTNLARALRMMQDSQFQCVGFAADAPLVLPDVSLQGHLALVLGAEGSGLRRLIRETCDRLVRIPIAPHVDSLNLSVAAAVALYECRRNRIKA